MSDEFLLLIVLLLIFFVCIRNGKEGVGKWIPSRDNFTSENTGMAPVFTKREKFNDKKNDSYEEKSKKALNDQMEYFQVCRDPDEIKKITECVCEGQDTFDYAENAYGARRIGR